MPILLRFIAFLPLPVVHFLGAMLGLLGLLRPRHRRALVANLRMAGLYSAALLPRVAMELGKGMLEMVPVWLRPLAEVTGWVREVRGWEHLEAARARGKGIIVLGPHLGCLELAGLYIAARLPITALYRRPRQDWAHELMQAGRNRGHAHMVEPDLRGVRALLTALKRNEAAWLLPDQRANKGEGVWAPFLGHWAYMPTLLYRLRASSGAQPLLFCCQRLSWGRGFRLDITPLPELPADTEQAIRIVNPALEKLIRALPAQYLWTYRIHRTRGDAPPEEPAR